VGVNLVLWLFFPNVFWFWWNAIGAVVTVGLGVELGRVLSDSRVRESAQVTSAQPRRPFPLRESLVMVIVFLVILVF